MKRRRLTSLLLSSLLTISMACSPSARMPVFAAEEAALADTSEVTAEVEPVEERQEESETERTADSEEQPENTFTSEEVEESETEKIADSEEQPENTLISEEVKELEEDTSDLEDIGYNSEVKEAEGNNEELVQEDNDDVSDESEQDVLNEKKTEDTSDEATEKEQEEHVDEEIEMEDALDPSTAEEGDVIATGDCSASVDDHVTWELAGGDNDLKLIISGSGAMKDYGYSGDSITPWYSYRERIKIIIVEKGITKIGKAAFWSCKSDNITIPDGVVSIGADAFAGSNTRTLTIPDSVTSIGTGAFSSLCFINHIVIPNSVENIGDSLFLSCESLETVTIECELTSIRHQMFAYCGKLEEIILPDSINDIGERAFYNCDSLKSISIPKNVSSIGMYAFGNCEKLEEVFFNGSAPSFDPKAFVDTVTTAYYPGDDASWTNSVRQNYGGTITWVPWAPGTIEEEGDVIATGDCSATEDDHVTWTLTGTDEDMTLIISGEGSTKNYSRMDNFPKSPWYTSGYTQHIKTIIIEDGISRLGHYLFFRCYYAEEIIIPDSVTEFGEGTFSGCWAVKYLNSPPSLSSIGNNAFQDCRSLEHFDIPQEMTSLGDFLFDGCNNLQDIILPTGLTAIGAYAFRDCKSLEEITIPNGVNIIGEEAFNGCSSITQLIIPENVAEIKARICANCTNLVNVELPPNIESIPPWGFASCENLQTVNIPKGVKSIQTGAFQYCKSINKLVLPDSVITIGESAFSNCYKLKDLGSTLPNIQSIASFAFNACSDLKEVYLSGDAPSFLQNCFISDELTVYYPWNNSTWTDDIKKEYGAYTISWVPWNPGAIGSPNELVYRAEFIVSNQTPAAQVLNNFLKLDTPCDLLSAKGEESGLDRTLSAWDGVTVTLDAFDDPTGLADRVLKPKDIYSGVIMQILGESMSIDLVNDMYEDAIHDSADIVSSVKDVCYKKYNVDIANSEVFKTLSEQRKKQLLSVTKEVFEEKKQRDLTDLDEVFSGFTTAFGVVNDVEDFYGMLVNYITVANMSDYMKEVLSQAYVESKKTDNTYLQMAFKECIDVIGNGVVIQTINKEGFVLGKKAAGYLFKELVWKDIKAGLRPEIQLAMACVSLSKVLTNFFFGTDDIQDAYNNMNAVLVVEKIFKNVTDNVSQKYRSDPSADNAGVYLSSLELAFKAMSVDCDNAYSFVETVDKTKTSQLINVFTGTDYSDKLRSIQSIKTSYNNAYLTNTQAWKIYLEGGYNPFTGQYDYSYIPYSTNTSNSAVKKVSISCPVNVVVYDSDGKEAASVIDGVMTCKDDDLLIAKNGESKTVLFYNNDDYRIECVGTDTGTMDVDIHEYDDSGKDVRSKEYKNVPLNNGIKYVMDVPQNNEQAESYVLKNVENQQEIVPSYDTATAETKHISIKNGFIVYNGQICLEADIPVGASVSIETNEREGYRFDKWHTSSNEALLQNVNDLRTVLIMPTSDLTVQAQFSRIENTDNTVDIGKNNSIAITGISTKTYSGSPITQRLVIKNGNVVLKDGTDYTVAYKNNVNAGTATVTITGKGNYTGTATKTFTIAPKNTDSLAISGIAGKTYTGKAQTQSVAVKDGKKALKKGTDYTVSYKNNINAGTATVLITGKENYTGTVTNTFTISKAANAVTANSFTRSYSVKAQKLALGAKSTGGKLAYKSNKSKVKVSGSGTVTIGAKFTGTAKITISAGDNNYQTATKTISITVPAKTKLSSTENSASKKIKIKWKKNTKVTGYQIQYGLKSNFKGAKKVTIKKNKTTSKVIKGLKKGKKYYVRIRTYKTVGGKKFYSAWSAKKTVTIKN